MLLLLPLIVDYKNVRKHKENPMIFSTSVPIELIAYFANDCARQQQHGIQQHQNTAYNKYLE